MHPCKILKIKEIMITFPLTYPSARALNFSEIYIDRHTVESEAL